MKNQYDQASQTEALTRSVEAALSGHRVRVRSYDGSTLVLVYYNSADERSTTSFDQIWNKLRTALRRARIRGIRSLSLNVQDISYWESDRSLQEV